MYDLATLRRDEFPLSSDILYFNHASISPLPTRSRAKMDWSSAQLSAHPMGHFMRDGLPMFEAFSSEFAAYFNAEKPSEIVSINNTNAALNAIAQAVTLQSGDNIVFCELEFPSNAYPWMSRAREMDGVEIRRVPAQNGGLTLEALRPYVDERTRIVAASAIQFFSGHRTDLAAIGAFCAEFDDLIFVVDAIQAAGHMKIDVQAMHIDVLASGGQKSLLAAPGVGVLYVREAVAEGLIPRIVSPSSTRDWLFWLDYDLTPMPGAERFSSGTVNAVGMFGLLESLRLIRELDVEQIDAHTSALTAHAHYMIRELGYKPLTVLEEHGPILTFESGLDSAQTDQLVAYLAEHNVSVVKHLAPDGRPHVRLSFHCYNTMEEIDQFQAIIAGFKL